ncbi:MAG TPA: DUF6777 domain-containing protein, partial [Acidimicrobiales bacterium]|nr:DUF6777 domain-containing protein [Acidimicrobiales bacterium]
MLGLGLAACGGGDDKPEEIVTEDITDTGDDPFTDPVAPDPSDEVEQFAEEGAGDSEGGNKSAQDSVPDDGLTPQEVTGDQVGLYGGTLDQEECDRQQLIDFLSQDADKARAWTEVQGIEADQFANYINSLTPVLLTQDTMVVNHGYEDGDAYGYLAVLRRGTAVLVDELGVPRVKCYCGNPLLEPVIPQDFVYDPGEATTTTTSSTTTTTTAETTTTTAAVTTTTTPPTDFDVPRDPGDYLEQLCRFLGIINCPDPPEEEPEDLPGLINPGVNICALFPAGCELEDEDPWRDFDPGGLTTIRPSLGPLTQFQIQDIESGELVVRP